MNNKYSKISIIFLMLGVFIFSNENAFGQNAPKKTSEKETAKSAKKPAEPMPNLLNSRVLEVLRETADDAKSWDDVKTSAEVQARIAEMIWDVDPISAEFYLKAGWEKAKQVEDSGAKDKRFINQSARVNAARAVLLVARKRTPELAKKWLDELTDFAEEDFQKNRGTFDDRTARSSVLLQLALQAAKDNPEAAASLAVESLRDGISFGLQTVLINIQAQNPELAQDVFRLALQRMENAGIADPNEILILDSYVYAPGQIRAAGNDESKGAFSMVVVQNQPKITTMAQLNPELAKEFLRVSANALLRLPLPTNQANAEIAAREQYSVIGTILSRIGDSMPAQTQALNERRTAILASTNFSPVSRTAPAGAEPFQPGESIKDYQSRVIDKMLENAERESNPLRRDVLYAQAALKTTAEMFERGKSIASKIEDTQLQNQITNFVIYRKTFDEIEKNELDSAYKILGKNSNTKQKAASLIYGASKLKENKDQVQINYWLSDAVKLFAKAESADEEWIKIGFGLANAYADVDKIESLKIFANTAKLIGETTNLDISSDYAPLANGFSGIEFINFTYDAKGFSLKSALAAYAVEDFEDVLASLKTIENNKTKGFGILELSDGYLKKMRKSLEEKKENTVK